MPDFGYDDPYYPDPDLSPIEPMPEPLFPMPLQPVPGIYFPDPIDPRTPSIPVPGGGSGGSGGSKGGFNIGDILKQLGLGTSSGGLDIGSLLGILALLGGGLNTSGAIKDASGELKQGAQDANKLATDTIGGAQANFKPYIEAGQGAIPQLQGMVGKGLAGQFNSAGTKSNLGGQFSGAMTLAQLMKGR